MAKLKVGDMVIHTLRKNCPAGKVVAIRKNSLGFNHIAYVDWPNSINTHTHSAHFLRDVHSTQFLKLAQSDERSEDNPNYTFKRR